MNSASSQPGSSSFTASDEDASHVFDAGMRAGEQHALAEAFTLCRARLRQVIQFRLDERIRARIDADDVLQDVFLAASQRLHHYAGSPYSSPFLWLRAILSQTMVELYRRHVGAQKRDPEREVHIDATPFPQATSTSLAIQLAGGATSPGEAAARKDTMGVVERAIEKMGPVDQEVLALRHFEELSNREVAEVLGITQKTASIRYVRALRRLRVVLAQMTAYFQHPR
jgi:RNA polymerase sigma-70 factor (ECF subfamily)